MCRRYEKLRSTSQHNKGKQHRPKEGSYFKIITKWYNKRYDDSSIVEEVDPVTYQYLKSKCKGKMKILMWNRANIKDHIYIKRCVSCWGFHHTKNDCQVAPRCSIRGEEKPKTENLSVLQVKSPV